MRGIGRTLAGEVLVVGTLLLVMFGQPMPPNGLVASIIVALWGHSMIIGGKLDDR